MIFNQLNLKNRRLVGVYRLFVSWIVINLIGLLGVYYISLQSNSKSFLKLVETQRQQINQDIERVYDNYSRELTFIKDNVEEIGLDKEEIHKFLNSKKSNVLDKANINTIIITDNEFKIVYAHNIDDQIYDNTIIKDREYLQKVKFDFDKVFVGKIIEGILTKKPSIPLAVGLRTNNGDFLGTVILSTNLKYLAQSLTKNYLNSLSLCTSFNCKESIKNYSYLKIKPATCFLFEILLSFKNSYSLGFVANSHKTFVATYDVGNIRKEFYLNYFLPNSAILISILILIALMFNYYVLRPLLPAILSITKNQKYSFQNQNIFSKVGELFLVQTELNESLSEKIEREKSLKADISTLFCMTDIITNKIEILSEDIEDILLNYSHYSQVEEYYINTLRKLYETSVVTKVEIKEVITIMHIVIKERRNQVEQMVDIIRLLNELDIPGSLIRVNKITQLIWVKLGLIHIAGLFYKNLLCNLFECIIQLIGNRDKILVIEIIKEGREIFVNFVCNLSLTDETAQALNLTKCRAWALVNSATVSVKCTSHLTVISIKFSTKFEDPVNYQS